MFFLQLLPVLMQFFIIHIYMHISSKICPFSFFCCGFSFISFFSCFIFIFLLWIKGIRTLYMLAGSLCKELFRISSTSSHLPRQESLFNGHKLNRYAQRMCTVICRMSFIYWADFSVESRIENKTRAPVGRIEKYYGVFLCTIQYNILYIYL